MTFLIEKVTPGKVVVDGHGKMERNSPRPLLPFEVEVEIETRHCFDSTCNCRSVFRLTDSSVRWLRKMEAYPNRLWGKPNPCVCLCMGRIIE